MSLSTELHNIILLQYNYKIRLNFKYRIKYKIEHTFIYTISIYKLYLQSYHNYFIFHYLHNCVFIVIHFTILYRYSIWASMLIYRIRINLVHSIKYVLHVYYVRFLRSTVMGYSFVSKLLINMLLAIFLHVRIFVNTMPRWI